VFYDTSFSPFLYRETPGARFELATNGLTDFRIAVAHNMSQKITIKELNV
jgi:hypothetical protein